MKRNTHAAMGALLLLFAIVALPCMAEESPVGYVQKAKGTVMVLHKDGKTESGAFDLAILPEDVISTGAESSAQIMFIDKTIMAMNENSKVSILDVYTPKEGGLFDMEFLSGTARVVTGQTLRASPEKFRATTPFGTIGIRGTELGLLADPDREVVMLYEGGPAIYTDAQVGDQLQSAEKTELCAQLATTRKKIQKAYDKNRSGTNFLAGKKAKKQLHQIIAYQAQYNCAP